MTDENPLANLGDLSKPATVLIEKISSAVGAIFEPWQIRRVAEAKADAEIIHATAELEVKAIQRRALTRFLQEEMKKQINIESITGKAVPQLLESANPKEIEDDWLVNFFDKCKVISDEIAQKLWAKILAGEANVPGSYSRRTVNALAMMSKPEAETFMHLCKFVWRIGDLCPLIFESEDSIYKAEGINFGSLKHLSEIGLITYQGVTGFRKIHIPKKDSVEYCGNKFILEFPKNTDNELDIGNVLFSQVGEELVTICNLSPVNNFINYVKEKWSKQGIIVVEAPEVLQPQEAV